jgi:hypothetical protein
MELILISNHPVEHNQRYPREAAIAEGGEGGGAAAGAWRQLTIC